MKDSGRSAPLPGRTSCSAAQPPAPALSLFSGPPSNDGHHEGPRAGIPAHVGPSPGNVCSRLLVAGRYPARPGRSDGSSCPSLFLSPPARPLHVYLHLRDSVLEASSWDNSFSATCYVHSSGLGSQGDVVLHGRSLGTSMSENLHHYIRHPENYKHFMVPSVSTSPLRRTSLVLWMFLPCQAT